MKKQEICMQGDKRIRCPKCKKYDVVNNGKHANGAQRYRCKSCEKRFNENTWANGLTKKEYFANEFLRHLFSAEKKYFKDAQKNNIKVNSKMIANEVSIKQRENKITKNNGSKDLYEDLFEDTFKFFNICTCPVNVAEPEKDWRPSRKYYISNSTHKFLFMLKGHSNEIYLVNEMPEIKCTELTLETPEYRIKIEKKHPSQRAKDLFKENFKKLRKVQENKLKKEKLKLNYAALQETTPC